MDCLGEGQPSEAGLDNGLDLDKAALEFRQVDDQEARATLEDNLKGGAALEVGHVGGTTHNWRRFWVSYKVSSVMFAATEEK